MDWQAARLIRVVGKFDAPEHNPAVDLSGIASATGRGPRRCLVINNEGLYAQFATFRRKDCTLRVGAKVPLQETRSVISVRKCWLRVSISSSSSLS